MLTVTTTEKQVFLQVDNYRKIPFYKGQLRFRLSDAGDRFYVYLWPSETPLINVSMSKGVTIDGQELTPENVDGLLEEIGAEQGGGGVTEHGELTGRDEVGQHPIGAITGLQNSLDALTTMQGNWLGVDFATYAALTAYDAELSEKPANKTWTFVNADENPVGGDGAQACYAWMAPGGDADPVLTFRYKILIPTTETDPVFTLWRDYSAIIRVGYQASGNGTYSVCIGYMSNANGTYATALGYNAKATARYSLAIGSSANVPNTYDYSVAIGYESIVNGTNEFSVGNANRKRKITNVANGTGDNDAVTVGQMNAGLTGTLTDADASTTLPETEATGLWIRMQGIRNNLKALFSYFTYGSANSAVKLAKAITISMTGDATGSASFDGSANISIPVNLNTLGLVKNGVVRISGNGGDYASAVGIVNARRYFKLVDVSYTSAGWDGKIIFDVFYTQAGGGGGWGNGEAQGKVVLRPTWNVNVFDIISTISGVDNHGIVILYNESAKVYSLYACASPGNYDSNRLYIDIRNLFAWAANNDNNNFMDSTFYASSGSYDNNTGLTQAQFDALPKTAVKWLWGG